MRCKVRANHNEGDQPAKLVWVQMILALAPDTGTETDTALDQVWPVAFPVDPKTGKQLRQDLEDLGAPGALATDAAPLPVPGRLARRLEPRKCALALLARPPEERCVAQNSSPTPAGWGYGSMVGLVEKQEHEGQHLAGEDVHGVPCPRAAGALKAAARFQKTPLVIFRRIATKGTGRRERRTGAR